MDVNVARGLRNEIHVYSAVAGSRSDVGSATVLGVGT